MPGGTAAMKEILGSPVIWRMVAEAMNWPVSARSSWMTRQSSFFEAGSVLQSLTQG